MFWEELKDPSVYVCTCVCVCGGCVAVVLGGLLKTTGDGHICGTQEIRPSKGGKCHPSLSLIRTLSPSKRISLEKT